MIVKVPGVNKILGTSATCTKGPAVCILSDKSLEISFSEREDNVVKAVIAKTGECKKYQIGSSKIRKEDKWFNAVKGVFSVLCEDHPEICGYDVVADGKLLDCEGFIVFAALTAGTVQALDSIYKLGFSIEEKIAVVERAFNLVSVQGNLSSIITMFINNPNVFVVYDGITNKYQLLDSPFNDSDFSMLVLDGNVPVATLREEVMTMEKEISTTWQEYYSKFRCHYIDFCDREFKYMLDSFTEYEKRICRFFYEEHRAAARIIDVIKSKDAEGFGRILDRIRIAAAEYIDATCPEIDWLIKRAYECPGCLGGSPFYEGYNTKGALIVKNEAIPCIMKCIDDYQHIFGFEVMIDIIGSYENTAGK